METLGVDVSFDEFTKSFAAMVVFVNDRPIKVELNTLDTGDMPYDFFQWTPSTDSPWGIGIPTMLTWLQEIINAAWRAMMDNAGDSSGANIIIGNSVEPVDNVWEITGKKIWRLLDNSDGDDVRKAFAQFQIQNNQPQLQQIIELALRFVDMETSMPQLFQGEHQEMPETLGATNIAVDSSNVALRSRVKQFDDQVTVPHITRYYHWNMQYNNKSEIKGDFNVDARGASVLYEKDQHAKTLIQLLAMKNDPDFQREVDWGKTVRQVLSSLKLDVAKSDVDIEKDKQNTQAQQPPPDPRVQAAQIKTQGDMEKAQLVNKSDMAEIERKGELEQLQLAAKLDEAEKDRVHDIQMKRLDHEMKMMELSQTKGIALDKIKASLSDTAMKLKTQVNLTNKKGEAPSGITTPIVEPPGRAAPGMAYTQ